MSAPTRPRSQRVRDALALGVALLSLLVFLGIGAMALAAWWWSA